jgi:ribonucleotide reductase beta subunit family protein with ferritin-like domain
MSLEYVKEKESDEELLRENPDRFTIFPVKYPEIWKYYKLAEGSFWKAEEVDLRQDISDWNKLDNDEKHFIEHVLAFFASADGIVNENLAQRFMGDVQLPEIRMFYGFQIMMENIHGEVYSLLIDTLVTPRERKDYLFKAIHNIPSINKLANWAMQWISSDKPFAARLIAFACVEGIMFSGPFCALFWLKQHSVMPGLTFSNELISRDEALHCEFACLLYNYLDNRLDQDIVFSIVEEAVAFEKEFITESLPCKLIGMNSTLMSRYIEFVADRLLLMLGYNERWGSENPFTFMEKISLNGKTNFFEKRVGEYSLAKFENSDKKDGLDQDF